MSEDSSFYVNECTFNAFVVELLLFNSKNRERGSGCNPSLTSNKQLLTVTEKVLAKWCNGINDRREELSPHHVTVLDEANFPWRKQQNDIWGEHYNELNDYKNTHNHCDVPFREDSTLGNWVWNQRKLYHEKSPLMTADRIERLESIGFRWIVKVENSWESMFGLLSSYNDEHSDCNVPSTYEDQTLANWVKKQRKLYKAKNNGKKSSITEDQISLLNGIGFQFVLRQRKKKEA